MWIQDENFTPEKAANASDAAKGLCRWVLAMSKYDRVAKVVAPKTAELKIAEAGYEEVMVGLRAKQAELKVKKSSAAKTVGFRFTHASLQTHQDPILCARLGYPFEAVAFQTILRAGAGGVEPRW